MKNNNLLLQKQPHETAGVKVIKEINNMKEAVKQPLTDVYYGIPSSVYKITYKGLADVKRGCIELFMNVKNNIQACML